MLNLVIPSGIIDIFQAGMDAILDDIPIVGIIAFPPTTESCSECTTDPIGNKSSNYSLSGRPIPFNEISNCPVCQGTGQRQVETTVNINMRIYWDRKEFVGVGDSNVMIPENTVQTKTYMTDMTHIMNAEELRISDTIQGTFRTYRFRRISEPRPHGFLQNRYCLTLWQRKI